MDRLVVIPLGRQFPQQWRGCLGLGHYFLGASGSLQQQVQSQCKLPDDEPAEGLGVGEEGAFRSESRLQEAQGGGAIQREGGTEADERAVNSENCSNDSAAVTQEKQLQEG